MTLRRALLLGVQSPHNGHRSGPNAYSSLWGDISIPPDMTFDRYSRPWSVVGLVAAIGCATLTAAALESRAAPATGQEVTTGEPRVSMELSRGWRFRQAEGLSGIESNAFDDSSWTAIELPHTSLVGQQALLSSVRRGRHRRGCLGERTLSRQARRCLFSIPFRRIGRHRPVR